MTRTPPAVTQFTEAEREIVRWVAAILEEPDASAQDNFLDLGGNSMLALDLNKHVKERFAIDLDMELLFDRTIGEAAADVVSRCKSTD